MKFRNGLVLKGAPRGELCDNKAAGVPKRLNISHSLLCMRIWTT